MPRQIGREVLVRSELSSRHGVSPGGDPLAQVWNRARAERDIDERVALEDLLALRFRVAAADRDDEIGPLALARAGIPEIGGEARVRLLADGARIEHDDVRGVRGCRLAETE